MQIRRIALTGVVAVLLAAAVAPAQASAARSFDVFAGKQKTRGDAHAYGALSFLQQGRQVSVSGWINDLCPKDGYGAYLTVYVRLANGAERTAGNARDTDGCRDGTEPFGFRSPAFAARIRWVEFRLSEWDQQSNRTGDRRSVFVDR